MQLRKCCAHPYLFGEEGASASASDGTEQLVACSGKLQLLDTLMGRLIARGHRTLIYSQFTRVLDILEDWLEARHWPALRIDGTIPGAERQRRIDRFNQQPEAFKVFLLSTRAGGVGINLATADTVIIFDSDWNPHNDLQAAARAHRLGQVRPVMVYRLVTRATIEERMMQVSRKKLALEYLVVRKLGEGARGKLKQSELDDILRYGAQELFADEEGAGDDAGADGGVKPDVDKPGAAADGCEAAATGKRIVWDDEALDRLLDRSGMECAATTTEADGEQGGSSAGGADELFGAFKVAHYNMDTDDTTRIAAAAAAALLQRTGGEPGELPAILQGEGGNLPAAVAQEGGQAGPAFWKDLLSDHWKAEYEAEQAKMGRGRRGRRQVDYADNKVWATIDTSDDEEDSDNSDDSDDSDASGDSGSCKPRNADAGDDGDEDFRVEDHEEGLNEEEDEEEEEEYVELEPEAALGPKRGRKPKTATSQTAKQRQHLGAQVSRVVDQAGRDGAVPIVAEAQPAGTGKADIVKKEHNWLTTMQERLEGLKKAVPAQLEGKQQLQEQKQEKEQNRKQEQEKQQQEQRRKQEEEQKRKQEQEQMRKQELAKQHQEQRHKLEEEQKRKQEEEQKRKQEQEEQRRKQEQEKQQQEQRRKQEEEQKRKQ
ncbi:P-loop containing nucleoside triphosphate hydrolase protein, partial [Haematococcus lacustris]